LVRSPYSANLPREVDVVRGGMSEPATLEACLVRVEAVFLVWPFLMAEAAPAVLDALKRHPRRIVYLSSMSVGDYRKRQADPINRFHADIERLIEECGLGWTFLRSGGIVPSSLPSRHLLFRSSSHRQNRKPAEGRTGRSVGAHFPDVAVSIST
jgi:uncharacterized protein YbjT (DUF2867 family)